MDALVRAHAILSHLQGGESVTVTELPEQPEQPVVTPFEDDVTFDQFAATMPETAQGFLDAALPQATTAHSAEDAGFLGSDAVTSDAAPAPRKTINISKKMKKSMQKFRNKIAAAPINWFHAQAKGNPEWELDDDEKELMQDSIGTVLDILEIEFVVEPLSWTLTSVWWVISYPVFAFAFLFLTKKSLIINKERAKQEPLEEAKQ